MAEGQTPGNGYTAPFGNGDGATQANGPSSGAHDFLKDPASGAPAGSGRDFTKESRPQQMGACPPNPQSVPNGGNLPFTAAPVAVSSVPFRLDGAAGSQAGQTGSIPEGIENEGAPKAPGGGY